MTLHAKINALAERFAHDLLRALRDASLDEILAETSPGHPRELTRRGSASLVARGGRIRRSSADLDKLVQRIIAAVHAAAKTGINAETLRAKLGVERKELPRPLSMALASKKIRKKGVKRSTTYHAR